MAARCITLSCVALCCPLRTSSHQATCLGMLPFTLVGYPVRRGTMLETAVLDLVLVPGGIDYAMLVMVKLGWLTKMQEKEYNYYIQLWMRAPGE